MRPLQPLFLVLLMAGGCAESRVFQHIQATNNFLSIRGSEVPGKDYMVSLKNVPEPGYDPDDPATRHRTALSAVRDQCPAGRIIGERVVPAAGWNIVKGQLKTYEMDVRCKG